MRKSLIVAASVATALFVAPVWAVEEAEPSNSVELIAYRGGDPAVWIYLEHTLTEKFAVYVNAAKSKGWSEVTVGPAYYITSEMQVGISAGVARCAATGDGTENSRGAVSAFWYLKTDRIESEVTVAKYGCDQNGWYRAYVQMPIVGRLSGGIYAETDVGVGLLARWKLNKNANIRVIPVLKKTGENKKGDITVLGGLEFLF